MEKQQEASAPPTVGDQPPPYPGNEPGTQAYAGGFAQPPPGKNNELYFYSESF